MKKHEFTTSIEEILSKSFKGKAQAIFEKSLLLQYINIKTQSATRGSKSHSSFANLYAIYVLVEDYLANGFHKNKNYNKYEGARFSSLFERQRQLPFGEKLQNHALNNRMNSEFFRFFPTCDFTPILRDLQTNRYWINENLLLIQLGKKNYNIAEVIIMIINKYITIKQESLSRFIQQCMALNKTSVTETKEVKALIENLLNPNVDARMFEIVSYAILKFFYKEQNIIWGYDMSSLHKDNLHLYKTGRTNANDGGIDFVMKPLGRFFQVTETLDFRKYFLDIEKIESYPTNFCY